MKNQVSVGAAFLVLCLSSTALVHAEGYETTNEKPPCPVDCYCLYEDDRFVVDCRDRDLTRIPDLSPLKETPVYRIYLDQNELTSIPENTFEGLDVEGIDLADNNELTQIDNGSFLGLENSLKYLSLQATSLDLHELSTATFLQRLPNLQVLNLANIETLSLGVIGNATFANLANLEELDLSGNGITDIGELAFKHMTVLTILKLNENSLTQIPVAIRGLANLQELTLVSNRISAIEENSLAGVIRLQSLVFSDNRLTSATVHAEAFSDCGSALMELNLEFNLLGAVPSDVFPHLKKLSKLQLNGNEILDIADGAFSELGTLTWLDISDNSLQLKADVFKGLAALKSLYLKAMGLSKVPTEALSSLRKLTELDLTSNGISSLNKTSFAGLQLAAFRKLTITYNGLEKIDADTFEAFPVPLSLILNNNRITDVTFLEDACRFAEVDLIDNTVNCTCSLVGFAYPPRPASFDLDGECTTPAEDAGTLLALYPVQSKEACAAMNITYVDEDQDCLWTSDAVADTASVCNSPALLASLLALLLYI